MGDLIARGLAQSKTIGTVTNNVLTITPSPISEPVKVKTSLGKNLFNKNTITRGYYPSTVSGVLVPSSIYFASDYIPIEGGKSYFGDSIIAFYDINKKFISGISIAVPRAFITPLTARYIRLGSYISSLDTVQIIKGTSSLPYEAFYQQINFAEADTEDKLISTIPNIIPTVVGHEMNIYFDNIICAGNINNYHFNVVCTVGTQQNERWTYIPAAEDIGNIALSIEVYRDFVLIDTLTTTIKVSAATKGTGQNPKVLAIGDSIMASGVIHDEMNVLFTADSDMDVTFVGTKGTSPSQHEAIAGWSIVKFYTDATSPFIFSETFDFAQYLSTNSLATPDYILFNLGINDLSSYLTDETAITYMDTMLARLDAMIANIKTSNANMIIGLCLTIPPSATQDSFGKTFGSSQSRWRYNRNNRLWCRRLINYYTSKTADNIYLIPINVNLDTVNNMETETVAVNSRNSATVVRQSNSVHPAVTGSYQIADTLYYWLKSMATS